MIVMGTHRESVIAGNTKNGRLISIGPDSFIGERIGPKRQMESKRFLCRRNEVERQWRAWQEEAKQEAFIAVENTKSKPDKDVKKVAASTTNEKKGQTFMYLLSFKAQRSSKPIAVYRTMEDVIDMSDALTLALEVAGTDGNYTVEEVPVWGKER